MNYFVWNYQDRHEWPEWAAESEAIEEKFAFFTGSAVVGLRVCTGSSWVRVDAGGAVVRVTERDLDVLSQPMVELLGPALERLGRTGGPDEVAGESLETDERPCTCPPDERPSPCPRRYALSECHAEIAALRYDPEMPAASPELYFSRAGRERLRQDTGRVEPFEVAQLIDDCNRLEDWYQGRQG